MATPPFQVKAVYDYSSVEEDDLRFPSGQVITVTDVEDEDWYFGEYADKAGAKQEGLFPKNFVKIFEPETPPRPSRANKSRKEVEALTTAEEAQKDTVSAQLAAPPSSDNSPVIPSDPNDNTDEQRREQQKPPSQVPKIDEVSAAPTQSAAHKPPTIPAASKPIPPATAEKPTSGSFRDRINAFNKPAAPPVAPIKPSGLGAGGGSGFVKKPFVAPPPSKNAYVPPPREMAPQKVHRREEESDIVEQPSRIVGTDENQTQQQQALSTESGDDDQPKPTSLKERIALLQKQQMEQAARRADTDSKKDKPKRPSKKQVDSQDHRDDQNDDVAGQSLEKLNSADSDKKESVEVDRERAPPARSLPRPPQSQEVATVESPEAVPSREQFSDSNDADQSGVGDTEDGEELSTGKDDSDGKPQRRGTLPPAKSPQVPLHDANVADEVDNVEDDDAEEEEDQEVDPEVKRRLEIRERMAKMSGGMGMAGMFGPPVGLPSKSSIKQSLRSSERKVSGVNVPESIDSPTSRAPPIPMVPMPGLQKVQQDEGQPLVDKEMSGEERLTSQDRDPGEVPDVEDIEEELVAPSRKSTERSVPPPLPQDRPVPPPPQRQHTGGPPPRPSGASIVPQSSDPRPLPPAHDLGQTMSPSEGSETDDEMSLHPGNTLNVLPEVETQNSDKTGPPPIPLDNPPSSLPIRPTIPHSGSSQYADQGRGLHPEDTSLMSPKVSAPQNRNSNVPPIPGPHATAPSGQNRPQPPPIPTNAPPPRTPARGEGLPASMASMPKLRNAEDDYEEVTEYEGDYDTDMASSAPHKDALKSYAKGSSRDEGSITEEQTLDTSLRSPLVSTSPVHPRAVPPLPPSQPPLRPQRQSSDMPRGAPPPPPPPKQQLHEYSDDDYDPFNHTRPRQRQPTGNPYDAQSPSTPRNENSNPMIAASPLQRSVPLPAIQSQAQPPAPPNLAAPSRSATGARQSIDVQRSSTTIRRSTDVSRPSGEQSFIASDADLGQSSLWWTHASTPPPVFQNRKDLIYEIEETSTTRRGGRQAITKTVYVLFMDYSQTVISAHFETKDPSNASLEQHHEPPPQALRQDQLENAHTRFGTRIAEGAISKEGNVIGDGSPNALILDSLSALPDALLPVGLRAYGALVYANFSNASVRSFDEIRPGDIVTFRNCKFSGHRGAMHSKYSIDIGKPDHVGIVIDWDGTKKKVRAWEQGRESKKVKSESFKLGDMRSGEVKVWRVMAREWVGWEGQN